MAQKKRVSNTAAAPSVFAYEDYRKYLKDFYTYRKKLDPQYSYQQFSLYADITSPNYLYRVIQKDYGITKGKLSAVLKGLKLKGRDAAHFELLVKYTDSRTTSSRRRYRNMLYTSLGNRKKIVVENEIVPLLNYDHHIVRALLLRKGAKKSPRWISRQLKGFLRESEAGRILKELDEWGFLNKEKALIVNWYKLPKYIQQQCRISELRRCMEHLTFLIDQSETSKTDFSPFLFNYFIAYLDDQKKQNLHKSGVKMMEKQFLHVLSRQEKASAAIPACSCFVVGFDAIPAS